METFLPAALEKTKAGEYSERLATVQPNGHIVTSEWPECIMNKHFKHGEETLRSQSCSGGQLLGNLERLLNLRSEIYKLDLSKDAPSIITTKFLKDTSFPAFKFLGHHCQYVKEEEIFGEMMKIAYVYFTWKHYSRIDQN